MTNEEKANEIARCDCKKHYKGFDLCNTYKFHEKNYCGRKAAALEAMELKDKQFQKVLDYAEICYGVFCFGQRENFINHIKDIFYEEEKSNQKGE